MKYLFILLVFTRFCFSSDLVLKKSDVYQTFEEILNLHVEHRQMSPLLIQRAFKIYFEQFDALKMYLLDSEVKAFLRLSRKRLEKGVARYQLGDLTDFLELNSLIQMAISRARGYRTRVERELTLSAQEIQESRGEVYLSYAMTSADLQARIQKQMIRIVMQEKRLNQMESWSPSDREKIFALWEKRFQRKEEAYLADNKAEEHNIAMHSLRALAKSLDAHTAYFSPKQALELRTSLEKQFEGVGVVLKESIYGVMIADLIEGGPAQKSGNVFIGDQIIAIDGKPIAGMSYPEVLKAMKGNKKNQLHLTLRRSADAKPREVTLLREKIMMNNERLQVRSVPYGNGQIGILTLPSFYEGGHRSSAEGDMREAIKKLKREAPLRGVILDLRENAGGFLSQAVKVSGLFISKGVVVISKYARGEIKYLRNLNGQMHFDGPLIVLTSKASASAAEIVAQALQDYGAAVIVGDEHTYGKGTIQYQTVTDKNAKAFYKVTVGRYYTVSGRSTQIEGVKADIVVPTIFSSYKIGERFLEYPLASDQVPSAYIDPLTDIDYRSRVWFQKNYLPNLHKPQQRWQKILTRLKENSELRLSQNKNFVLFLKANEKKKGRSPRRFRREKNPEWGNEDLQMKEAVHIMQDMIAIEPS